MKSLAQSCSILRIILMTNDYMGAWQGQDLAQYLPERDRSNLDTTEFTEFLLVHSLAARFAVPGKY